MTMEKTCGCSVYCMAPRIHLLKLFVLRDDITRKDISIPNSSWSYENKIKSTFKKESLHIYVCHVLRRYIDSIDHVSWFMIQFVDLNIDVLSTVTSGRSAYLSNLTNNCGIIGHAELQFAGPFQYDPWMVSPGYWFWVYIAYGIP